MSWQAIPSCGLPCVRSLDITFWMFGAPDREPQDAPSHGLEVNAAIRPPADEPGIYTLSVEAAGFKRFESAHNAPDSRTLMSAACALLTLTRALAASNSTTLKAGGIVFMSSSLDFILINAQRPLFWDQQNARKE